MTFHQALIRTLWIAPLLLQFMILYAILARRLLGIAALFFSYTVFVFGREVLLLFLKYPGQAYSLIYWWGELLAVLLGLAAIWESLRNLFPPHPFSRIVATLVTALGACAALAATLMFLLTRATSEHELILLAERSARFFQAALLIVLIACMSRLGSTLHHYSVGIVAGFGIYSASVLLFLEFRAHLHILSDSALAILNSAAYNVAVCVWAYYFLRSRQRTSLQSLPEADLDHWNQAIAGYLSRWYRQY